MSQEETELRLRMVADARKQGFWAANINDRFVSGYPDIRLAKMPYGQIDFELKIIDPALSTWGKGATVKSGIRKLQAIELRDMNAAGARAVGLILVKPVSSFFFCNSEDIDLGRATGDIHYSRLPLAQPCVDFDALMNGAARFLKEQGID